MAGYLSRLGIAIAVAVIALAIAIIAIIIFCAGLYLTFRGLASQPTAAFLTGLSALVVSALLVGMVRLLIRVPRTSRASSDSGERPHEDGRELAGLLGSQIAQEIARLKLPPKYGIAASIVAGFSIGASPRLRHSLAELVKRVTLPK